MERLKALDNFKNRFFGYISHEFKTPLTIIMGQAKRLPNECNPPEVARNAAAILHQSQSMLEMVDQMVDITRLDNQELLLNWRHGNFSDYVRYLVESLRSLADFKAIRLDFHSTVPDLMMDFDPLRLKYMVNNLLSNAVRHTSAGGLIRVSLHASVPDEVRMDVLDTGKGIAPEAIPNIFDRYYQGNSNDLEPHHFGLGLAFVKDLLQLFAGTITVSSRLGKGTIFTISLPVTRNAQPLETSFAEPMPPPEEIKSQPTGTSRKSRPLLLVVEDNPFISKFMESSLSNNFLLEFVPDGVAGYEKAVEIIPDLILTDVMMP
ncbi:MAG: hybrid sensor histidine kinase/response regulator, partial [Saprospiraceae bacterium]|nr:hybrid sensor histidine kinase/response regulator [Saprospiraceae bacterium]